MSDGPLFSDGQPLLLVLKRCLHGCIMGFRWHLVCMFSTRWQSASGTLGLKTTPGLATANLRSYSQGWRSQSSFPQVWLSYALFPQDSQEVQSNSIHSLTPAQDLTPERASNRVEVLVIWWNGDWQGQRQGECSWARVFSAPSAGRVQAESHDSAELNRCE
ncbi:hypothetical protein K438DRAFT_1771889 [Mycena galopus ATCC 62051]|nr:hypothetical protein K438DRAFT_1771889 [Mycena galopus ATCC 62051]